MGRHSKHNTNSAHFTYAERQWAQGGSKKGSFGAGSMRNFDACCLCLARAVEPRICSEGHLYCNECIVSDLLAQKKDMKRQQAELERMRLKAAEQEASVRQQARERVLRDFEQTQSGLSAGSASNGSSSNGISAGAKRTGTEALGNDEQERAKKQRKLDEESSTGATPSSTANGSVASKMEQAARDSEQKALNDLALELAEARRAKLPNFWLPSLTPSATPTSIDEIKLQTICHGSQPPHPISLKSLQTVKFATEDDGKGGQDRSCPSCRKALTNNVKSFVVQPCGDVLCSTCVDSLCKPDGHCAACSVSVSAPKASKKASKESNNGNGSGYIEIKREGTGYASGGQVEVKKKDLAFQA